MTQPSALMPRISRLVYNFDISTFSIYILNFLQLNLVTYKSSTTGKHEVACYMFLEKEDERNIRDAVRGWKLLMPYKEIDVGGSIYKGIVSSFV